MERKVRFRVGRVKNKVFGVWECVIHREGMTPLVIGLAKKDIALVAVVANTMSCMFDNVALRESDNIEFELTVKINRK